MPEHSLANVAMRVAATCSLGAGLIHAVVMPEHWREWNAAGGFFLALAAFQCAWGVLSLARSPVSSLVGPAILVNGGAAMVWVASRTTSLTWLPSHSTVEPVGAIDIVATTLGLAVALLAVAALVPYSRRVRVPPARQTASQAISLIAVAMLTTSGLVLGGPEHHGVGEEHSHTDFPSIPAPDHVRRLLPGASVSAPPSPSEAHDDHAH